MKKIFTLMLTLAVALFAGVSCTNDQGAQSGKTVKVTVSGAPEANLPATAGEFTLNYAIDNATLTGVLEVTTEAAWIHVGEVGADSVPFTYDANTDSPGSPAREAVISFAYTDADPVTVTVKQDSAAATFSVEFSEVTTNSAIATLTLADQNMDWLCLFATSSQIAEVGTPAEYINAQYEAAKAEGFPYLYMLSSIYMGGGSMGKGNSVDPIMCQMPWSAQEGDKLYMFVLGYNVDADLNNWEYDNSTLAAPAHIWEVPFLPVPVVTVATENTVTSAAGELDLDVTVENAIEGAYVKASCDDTWVVPTYADGKLTLTYEANATALARQATIYVDYAKKTFYGEGQDDWYEENLVQSVEVVLTQEKDANAEIVTFDIQVVETHFNRIVVNVTPSNLEVDYVLATTPATTQNWETGAWEPVDVNWLDKVNSTQLSTTYKGALADHSIIMNPSNYEWFGLDYHVYAFAVNADKTAPAGEASHVPATVNVSDMPALTWDVEKSGLTWNEDGGRYELNAVEGSTVVLHYVLTNPVDGASVKLNGSSLYDNYNVVDGEPVIDNAAKTITLKIDAFDSTKNYHYVSLNFNYTNEANEMWGVQTPSLRVNHVQKPAPTIITSVADLKAGDYYVAGKLATYTSGSSSYDWTNYPYHFWTGAVSAQGNTTSNSDLLTVNGNELMELDPNMSSQDAVKGNPGVITLVAVEGKTNTYYVKSGDKYLYSCQSGTNRRMQLGDTPTEWVFTDHAKGGINLASNEVYLATAGATYNLIRSYKVSSAASSHQHGLVFFVK